jgi:hypothetical protein
MTDRLATLMHGEVETLDIPAAPAAEILATGRRIRRRSRSRRGAAAVVLAGVVVTGTAVALHGGGSETAQPAVSPPAEKAYAVGDTVYIGDGSTTATMPEVAQTIYYTSAGLLVRTNKNGYSDGGAPFHFELVRPDGTTTKLGVTLGEVAPSVDPAQPYLAWATMTGGKIQVIVHDVSTDRDVATVDVPGTFDWGGWDAPPVSLSGDLVYVGTNDQAEVVNWRTGEATTSDVVPGSVFPDIQGGRLLVGGAREQKVVDAQSGKVLLSIPTSSPEFPDLSPDGRFVLLTPQPIQIDQDSGGGVHTEVYDVDTGAKILLPPASWGWSRTADEVFRVEGSTMTTCSTTTGDCHDVTVPPVGKNADVRYGGSAYES